MAKDLIKGLTPEQEKEQAIEIAKKKIANKALDEKNIHEKIIEAQAVLSEVTNMIDAFGREHASNESNAQIYIWTQSIEGSIRKAKALSKTNLTSDGVAKSISLGIYNIDISYTIPGLTLDTAKFKKLDTASYMFIAKKFAKKSTKRVSVKVTEKKGVV